MSTILLGLSILASYVLVGVLGSRWVYARAFRNRAREIANGEYPASRPVHSVALDAVRLWMLGWPIISFWFLCMAIGDRVSKFATAKIDREREKLDSDIRQKTIDRDNYHEIITDGRELPIEDRVFINRALTSTCNELKELEAQRKKL